MDLRIRQATEADAAQIRTIYAPFCGADSAVSFEIVPPTVAEIARRVVETTAIYPWLVCAPGDDLLGYADAGRHSERAGYLGSVATAISIDAGQRRAGVGRTLSTALLGIFRAQGFASAFAGTTLPNPAGIGLHRAMGFEPVGIDRDVGHVGGTWVDTAWWQVSLRGRLTNPQPPTPVGLVLGTPAWDEAIAAGLAELRPR